MIKLVKEHYFVGGDWKIQKAQVFLTSRHWLLALMHRSNFGLDQRFNKKVKYLEEVLLRCRVFHNGLRRKCKTHSGYVFFRDNPRHKYRYFIPEC